MLRHCRRLLLFLCRCGRESAACQNCYTPTRPVSLWCLTLRRWLGRAQLTSHRHLCRPGFLFLISFTNQDELGGQSVVSAAIISMKMVFYWEETASMQMKELRLCAVTMCLIVTLHLWLTLITGRINRKQYLFSSKAACSRRLRGDNQTVYFLYFKLRSLSTRLASAHSFISWRRLVCSLCFQQFFSLLTC